MIEFVSSALKSLSSPNVTSAASFLFPALLLIAPVAGWLFGRARAAFTFLVFAFLLDFGWWAAGWVGLLFLSLPALFLYWLWLGIFSEFLLPHTPKTGWRRGFKTLIGFAFGRNRPYVDVQNGEIQQRMGGNLMGTMVGPGLILSAPHQAVALHTGFGFSRVARPGLIFTHRYERILQVLDLRTHIWKKSVDAITRDGIPICILLFIPARIANPIELSPYQEENPLGCRSSIRTGIRNTWQLLLGASADEGMKEGKKDQPLPYKPLYQFQERQIFSLIRAQGRGSSGEHSWGDLIKDRAENITQNVLSCYSLDGLLTFSTEPAEMVMAGDTTESEQPSPLDQAREAILQRLREEMNGSGIEILGLGVANIEIRAGTEDELVKKTILEQRLENWQAQWMRRMLAEQGASEADALRVTEAARADAQRDMILSIAEGFQPLIENKTAMQTDLVALRFIDVMEEMIDTPAMRPMVPTDVVHTLDNLRHSLNWGREDGSDLHPNE